MSKFLGFVHLYFVDFEESPLDICRAVKLQLLSHLANRIICAVLLLLVFQLVQKPGVCKWPCCLPFKIRGGGQYVSCIFFLPTFLPEIIPTKAICC